jgi:hypothetical protein
MVYFEELRSIQTMLDRKWRGATLRESSMIRSYLVGPEERRACRTWAAILVVQHQGKVKQEDRVRTSKSQDQRKGDNQIWGFTSGLMLGAAVAGSIVTGLLKLKRNMEQPSPDVFTWPEVPGIKAR